jgi:hypothetical protein
MRIETYTVWKDTACTRTSTSPDPIVGTGASLSRTKAFEGSPLRTIRQTRCFAGTNLDVGTPAALVVAMLKVERGGGRDKQLSHFTL